MNMYKQVIGRICLLTISCLFLTQLLIVTASAESRSVEEMVNDEEKSAETNEVEQDIDSEEITADTTDVGLSAWDFIKMIFATVFVVALLYGLLKFVNKKAALINQPMSLITSGDCLRSKPLGASRQNR